MPPAPTVQAGAYVIENAATGEVLASSNAHERLPIASITKLMTVLVVLQHRKLSDVVTVDPRAAAVGEESIYLTGGERITVSDLLKGALIQSANDAADALALSVAPSFPAFAKLMNAEAAELGLHDTHFVRPDGLDARGRVFERRRRDDARPDRHAHPRRARHRPRADRHDPGRAGAAHVGRPARRRSRTSSA